MTTATVNRAFAWLLRSGVGPLLARSMVLLRYSATDGREIVLPVQASGSGTQLVVRVGDAASKRWWRHFIAPHPLEIYARGQWRQANASATVAEDGATTVAISLDANPPALRGGALMSRWFWSVTIAEFAGFAVPALAGAATARASTAVTVTALLIAGAVEGALLGSGQASVLRLAVPELPQRRWIINTAIAAVLAYLLGLMPSLLFQSAKGWPTLLVVVAAITAGLALLATIGVAQWLVLRHHLPRVGSWILTTAAAWLVALGLFLGLTMPLWRPDQPLILSVAIGMAGGLLMAATSSAITGFALCRLVRRQP